jgi:amino acid transporter
MQEMRRDIGLVRAVTTWGLTASLFNAVVGAGIFAVPAALAASVGSYAPLAFLLCAAGIGSVAICFAEGGSRIPTSGGPYGYIEAAFGPLFGYIAGTLLWFADVLACGSVAAALADVVVSLLPAAVKSPAHAIVIIAVITGVAFVNIGGVQAGAKLIGGATVFKMIPLAIFIVAGAGAIHRANFLQTVAPTSSNVGRALILALFALTGMESPLGASGEIANPARTIPRALAASMFCITLLYVTIQFIAQGILGSALPAAAAPLADAMAGIHPALRLVMIIGAGLSMFGWLGADLLGSPRVLFAFAREGLLPRVLGLVHPNSHAPHVAILTYAILAMGVALSGTFAELAVLSTLGAAGVYIMACAAAWWLARRGVAMAGTPLGFRWLGCAMGIGITSMLLLIALATRAEIVGLLSVVGISALIYLGLRRMRKPAAEADYMK